MHAESLFRSTPGLDAALDLLADEVGAIGFDAVDYGFMPRIRDNDGRWSAPDIVARNLPAEWELGWSRYSRDDPYLWSCYRRNLPLDWDEVKSAGWLSTMQKQAIAYIDELGFGDGVTVPIHLPGGSFAFVSALAKPRQGAWRAHKAQMTERLFFLGPRLSRRRRPAHRAALHGGDNDLAARTRGPSVCRERLERTGDGARDAPVGRDRASTTQVGDEKAGGTQHRAGGRSCQCNRPARGLLALNPPGIPRSGHCRRGCEIR